MNMNHFGYFIWDVNPKNTVKLVELTKSLTSNFLNFHTDIAIVIVRKISRVNHKKKFVASFFYLFLSKLT